MKDRSGKVGATGVAAAVRALHARGPAIRIHLVGHSLEGLLQEQGRADAVLGLAAARRDLEAVGVRLGETLGQGNLAARDRQGYSFAS